MQAVLYGGEQAEINDTSAQQRPAAPVPDRRRRPWQSDDRADRRPRKKIISCGGTWLNKCGRVSFLIKARRRHDGDAQHVKKNGPTMKAYAADRQHDDGSSPAGTQPRHPQKWRTTCAHGSTKRLSTESGDARNGKHVHRGGGGRSPMQQYTQPWPASSSDDDWDGKNGYIQRWPCWTDDGGRLKTSVHVYTSMHGGPTSFSGTYVKPEEQPRRPMARPGRIGAA